MLGKKEVFLVLIVLVSLVIFNINKEDITGNPVATSSSSTCALEPTPEILYIFIFKFRNILFVNTTNN